MFKRAFWLFLTFVLIASAGALIVLRSADKAAASMQASLAQGNKDLPRADLAIVKADGSRVSFKVEIARTDQEQARGLMYRRSVPDGTGMIFWFDPPQPVGFWMKNTLVPLDLLFIRADGSVAQITANAKPLDETTLPCLQPVRVVFEIGGGQAAALGIKVGDRVDLAPVASSVK